MSETPSKHTNKTENKKTTPEITEVSIEQVPTVPPSVPAHTPHHVGAKTLHKAQKTRASAYWAASIFAVLALIALIIFILQNQNKEKIVFLGWEASIPSGVALLIAAVAGSIITGLIAGVRIVQLRHAVRKAGRVLTKI